MSNWLEDEERKKILKDREISLLVQREATVQTHLRRFYDLCHRVNGVRYDSLSIDRLKVECKLSRQSRTDSYQSFHTVDERRGIQISCCNQDETFIDVVIKKHSRDVYWLDDVPPADYSSDEERVVIRNTCTLQDLIDWREDQIIQLIQWLLLESEVIKGSIPGKEIKNELAEAEAKKAKAEAEAARFALETEAKRRALDTEKRRTLEAAAKRRTLSRLFIGSSVVGIIIFLLFYFFRPTLGEGDAYVRVEPGEFNMGCSTGDEECGPSEKPAHRVRISRAYEIGKYEVTQRQWEAVMGSNPSQFKGATLPVAQISWQDVQMFLGRLNARKDGHRYRLPTEAEWEYRGAEEPLVSTPGHWILSRGTTAIPVIGTALVLVGLAGRHTKWARNRRTGMACTTCKEMPGNSVRTGIPIKATPSGQSKIRRVQVAEHIGWFAADRGTTRRACYGFRSASAWIRTDGKG